MLRQGRLTAGLNWYRANFDGILFKRWPICDVPTLSIWSDQDPYLTEKQVQDSKKYMSAKWAYIKIEKTGHWVPIEQAKRLFELTRSWFKEC